MPTTGHEDPPGEAPWALQLVGRVERASRPSRTAVYEAAAMAVVALLADDRSRPDGEWGPSVERWLAGRIRKIARRARGADWERVQALPGVTVLQGGAEVRALVPGPVDEVPPEVSRLQLRAWGLDAPGARPDVAPVVGGAVVVSLAAAPLLSTGKGAAAAGHAAQLAWMMMEPARRRQWAASGFEVVVEQPGDLAWLVRRQTAPVVVVDAGYTEVEPDTCTAVARWV